MATRPHLTEEMQAFLQTEFGTTNISGTANALLVIGLYAIGVQPPTDEAPRLLRRSDLPARLAGYVRAIGENPGVPASPLLSPQVMSILNQLLAGVQSLTSTPWRIPDVQQHASQQSGLAGNPGIVHAASEPSALQEPGDDDNDAEEDEHQEETGRAAVFEPEEQPEVPAITSTIEPFTDVPATEPTEPAVEQATRLSAPVVRSQRERPRAGRQRHIHEPQGPVSQNSPVLEEPPPDAVSVLLPASTPELFGPEEEGETAGAPVVVADEGTPTRVAPKRRPLGRTFQG